MRIQSKIQVKLEFDYMKSFESFWNDLLKELATPKKIKNWTAIKGYYGEDFTAQVILGSTGGNILCTTLQGSKSRASMEDFHMVYKHWEGYLSGTIQRQEFLKTSRVTKYTISTIHQLLEK